jgi:hypothetical protein
MASTCGHRVQVTVQPLAWRSPGFRAAPAGAHSQIVAAMISGDLAPLEAWLDARHGPGSFTRIFRAPTSGAEPGLVR